MGVLKESKMQLSEGLTNTRAERAGMNIGIFTKF